MAGSRRQAWNDLVRNVEDELAERGPSETDERKIRFLVAAYLRDIRDAMTKQKSSRSAYNAPTNNSWNVPPSEEEDDGGEDTRPFAFIEELKVKRPETPPADGSRGERPPKK